MSKQQLRDVVAQKMCMWIMRHVASEKYRKHLGAVTTLGIAAYMFMQDDQEENNGKPCDDS